MNIIVRDLLRLVVLGLLAHVVFYIATSLNVANDILFTLGMCMGVIICFVFGVLSILVTNISVIIKLTTASTEDFGKFLKESGFITKFEDKEEE